MIHAPLPVNLAGGATLSFYQSGGTGGDDGGDDPKNRRVGRGHEVDAPPAIPAVDEDDEDNNSNNSNVKPREKNQNRGRGVRRPYHRHLRPEEAPLITEPCAVCKQRFWSVKALHGHYRVHSDRGWRGVLPPWRRPQIRKPNKEREVAKSLIILAGGPDAKPQPEFKCACGRIFDCRQALGGHRATHKNVQGCFARETKDKGKEVVVVEGEAQKKRRGRPKKKVTTGETSRGAARTVGESSKGKRVMLDLNLPVQPEEDEDDKEGGKGFDLNIPQDENDNESSSTPLSK